MKRIALTLLSIFGLILLIGIGSTASSAQIVEPPICGTCPQGGICTTECRPITPGVFTNPDWLKVKHHRVDVQIDNQIARTSISMEFVNEGNGLAEGTFIFPLPMNASVEQLIMYINDLPIEARVLDAREAREIYDTIVRQYRDPALLEYIGTNAIQANVFPIPPGETRRIEITYSQVLEVDNGLLQYVYPLDVTRLTTQRAVEIADLRLQFTDPQQHLLGPIMLMRLLRERQHTCLAEDVAHRRDIASRRLSRPTCGDDPGPHAGDNQATSHGQILSKSVCGFAPFNA